VGGGGLGVGGGGGGLRRGGGGGVLVGVLVECGRGWLWGGWCFGVWVCMLGVGGFLGFGEGGGDVVVVVMKVVGLCV